MRPWRQMCTAQGRHTATMASMSRFSHVPCWFPAASHTCVRHDAAVTAAEIREWKTTPARRGTPPATLALTVPGTATLALTVPVTVTV